MAPISQQESLRCVSRKCSRPGRKHSQRNEFIIAGVNSNVRHAYGTINSSPLLAAAGLTLSSRDPNNKKCGNCTLYSQCKLGVRTFIGKVQSSRRHEAMQTSSVGCVQRYCQCSLTTAGKGRQCGTPPARRPCWRRTPSDFSCK